MNIAVQNDIVSVLLLLIIIALIFFILHCYKIIGNYKECNKDELYKLNCDNTNVESIELMSQLDRNAVTLIQRIYNKSKNGLRGTQIKRLRNQYSNKSIQEATPNSPNGDTSFVIQGGSVIALCIRKWNEIEQKWELYDVNTMMYVLCHELAHLACDDMTHSTIFWDACKWLLQEAVEAGLYTIVDYAKYPIVYCGKVPMNSNILLS